MKTCVQIKLLSVCPVSIVSNVPQENRQITSGCSKQVANSQDNIFMYCNNKEVSTFWKLNSIENFMRSKILNINHS